MSPGVSVLLCIYNGETKIRRTVRSVLEQTYDDFELIIIDDGSTDDTSRIIDELAAEDTRIRVFHRSNHGLTKSLNFALSQARAEYAARIDAGDTASQNRLELQKSYLDEHPKVALCGSQATSMHDGTLLERPLTYPDILSTITMRNPFVHSSIFARTDLLRSYGGYDETYTYSQDYNLWVRIAAKHEVINLEEPLIQVEIDFRSISYDKMKQQEWHALRARWTAIRNGLAKPKHVLGTLIAAVKFVVPATLKKAILRRRQQPDRLTFVFTYGIGLKEWKETGIIDRRKRMYDLIPEDIDIQFFTYDTYPHEIDVESRLLYNSRSWNPVIYSLLGALQHYGALRRSRRIVTVQMLGSWSGVIARILTRRPLVVRQGYSWSAFEKHQGHPVKYRISRIAEFISLLFAEHCIVTANDQKASLEKLNITKTPITLIPNGIDTSVFAPADRKKNPRSLVTIGRLNSQKNHKQLLKAIRDLDCSLTIIGEGELLEDLQEYAKQHRIDVTFTGNIPNDELPGRINEHEIYVFPSLYEGNPKALLEAMSCEMPCVASEVDGNRDLIEDGINGVLTGTDADSIREGIQRMLASKELRRTCAANARKTVQKSYDLKTNIKREAEIYLR